VIIMQRCIELQSRMQRVMAVVKVRGSAHSKEIRAYEITKAGIAVGEMLPEYDGLLTGHPDETARVAANEERKRRARS
jgi:circadian clock protein KaiC